MTTLGKIKNALYKNPLLVDTCKRAYKSRWLNNSRLWQRLILSRAQALDASIDVLPALSIETVLSCNARCVMCLHGRTRMVGEMDMALFEKLIQEVAELGLDGIGLSIYGEPFLDRHWMERIRLVRSHGLEYGFFSNASLMRQEMVEEMLSLGGWKTVNFSVNGFSPEVYEAVMPPLKRDTAYDNIQALLDARKRLGLSEPEIRISCVRLQKNAHELNDFVSYWQHRGADRVVIADCGDWLEGLNSEQLQDHGRSRGVREETWLAPCPSVWQKLYVYVDGRVSTCCEDAGVRQLIVGHAGKHRLQDIYQGPAVKRLRRMHLENRRAEHPVCGRCRWNPSWF
jgi:MoaA/NifB/PqqE/SkfB family radical SAM enzyme